MEHNALIVLQSVWRSSSQEWWCSGSFRW